MKVRIPDPLRSYTQQEKLVTADGTTLAELLADLDRQYPGIRFRMIDEQHNMRKHMKVFVNDEAVRDLGTILAPTDEITIEFWQNVTAARQQSTLAVNFGSATNRINVHAPWSDGVVYWDFGDLTGGHGPPAELGPFPIMDAVLLAGRLRSLGIPAMSEYDADAGPYPALTMGGLSRVFVRAEDAERAREIAERINEGGGADADGDDA